jgi:glycosyltransferase involved in cell wall biosynthesis
LFSIRNTQKKIENIKKTLGADNVNLNVCSWFPKALYDEFCNFVPYRFFFGHKVQITHSFDYLIPFGVYGKKIITIYDMTFKAFPETMASKYKDYLRKNINLSIKRANKIVTISEFSQNEIVKYLNIDPKNISVIPCGVDRDIFFPITNKTIISDTQKKYNIHRDYFLYIGTLEPRKNIERLIDSYSLLKMKYNDLPLLLLGGKLDWLYEPIITKIKTSKLEKNVISLGYIPDEDIVPLICGAHAFVYPSLYEGFGIPPLEAMSCGVPVLTSNTASLPEVVGNAAITANPFDIEEIANGLERLLLDNELRKDLIQKGLERSKKFSWEHSASLTMDLYKSLI